MATVGNSGILDNRSKQDVGAEGGRLADRLTSQLVG